MAPGGPATFRGDWGTLVVGRAVVRRCLPRRSSYNSRCKPRWTADFGHVAGAKSFCGSMTACRTPARGDRLVRWSVENRPVRLEMKPARYRGSRRSLLSAGEMLALDEALIDAYRQHRALCETHPIAAGRISRPGIPSSFSESLTALLAPQLLGPGSTAAFGGRACDLLITTGEGRALTAEVKASGVSRFQELKERDLAADSLVWVDFGSRFVDGHSPVIFHHLPRPDRFLAPRRKLTLDVFLRAARELDGFMSILVADLRALLNRNIGRNPDSGATVADRRDWGTPRKRCGPSDG